jgi:isoleucyl-tRNA synthetase
LYECLTTVAKLLAPFTPFVADELHRNLSADADSDSDSVHLADWPVADAAARDEALEGEMERARAVVSLGLSARNEAKLKVRQPLRRALVMLPDAGSRSGRGAGQFSDAVAAEVAEALNVKRLEAVTDLEGLLDYTVVPNFRALGPKAGKRVPLVKDALAGVDGATVRAAFERDGGYDLALGDGMTLRLEPDDVEVRAASHEEFALAQEGGYAVAIDTLVDDELRAEGIARDLIRLLNDLRKAQGLEIADRIRVRLGATGRVEAAAHLHRDWIAHEVLAVEFEIDPSFLGGTALDVDGATVSVWLERVEE